MVSERLSWPVQGIQIGSDRSPDQYHTGEPFRTSGCEGYDGEVACNRPFGNSRPGPDIRNFLFKPDQKDMAKVRNQLKIPDDRKRLNK